MLATRIARATHAVHKPMIRFLGPRKNIPHSPHTPAPHPAAPPEIVDSFQSFVAKLQTSSSSASSSASSSTASQSTASAASSKPADYEFFWEAPAYLWQPKELSEREVEAVMSGGATDIRTGP